jgi:hypothetical protein
MSFNASFGRMCRENFGWTLPSGRVAAWRIAAVGKHLCAIGGSEITPL